MDLEFLYVSQMMSHFCNDIFLRGAGACFPGKFLNYGSLKRHFLHFEGILEQNFKVLNDIFLQGISHRFEQLFQSK